MASRHPSRRKRPAIARARQDSRNHTFNGVRDSEPRVSNRNTHQEPPPKRLHSEPRASATGLHLSELRHAFDEDVCTTKHHRHSPQSASNTRLPLRPALIWFRQRPPERDNIQEARRLHPELLTEFHTPLILLDTKASASQDTPETHAQSIARQF